MILREKDTSHRCLSFRSLGVSGSRATGLTAQVVHCVKIQLRVGLTFTLKSSVPFSYFAYQVMVPKCGAPRDLTAQRPRLQVSS